MSSISTSEGGVTIITERGVPNLFGRSSPLDYPHLEKIHDKLGPEAMERQIALREKECGGRQLQFKRWAKSANDFNTREAAILGFITDSQTHLAMEAEYQLYRTSKWMRLLPTKTNIPFGAKTVQYQVYDLAGEGKFIDDDGSNIEYVSVKRESPSYNLRYAGIGVKYNFHELESAAFGGTALNPLLMRAAMRGANNHMEKAWFQGLKNQGTEWSKGLINLATTGANKVGLGTASTSTWDGASPLTAPNILEFIGLQIDDIQDDQEIVGNALQGRVVVVLPPTQYKIIRRRPLSETYPNRSIWSYVEENNTWTSDNSGTLEIFKMSELIGAGASSSDRMIVGLFTEEIMEGRDLAYANAARSTDCGPGGENPDRLQVRSALHQEAVCASLCGWDIRGLMADKITREQFRAQFPDLSAHDDSLVDLAIDDAQAFHTATKKGQLFASAHLLTVGEKKELQRHRTGPIEANYYRFGTAEGDSFWASTGYGRKFRALEQVLGVTESLHVA